MNEAKHTPWPWTADLEIKWERNGPNEPEEVHGPDYTIFSQDADTIVATVNGLIPEGKDNAALFATAPELLDALQCLVRAEERRAQYDRINSEDDMEEFIEMAIAEALDKARAAIAKAEGRPE